MTDRDKVRRVVDYIWGKALESSKPDHFVNRREYVDAATTRVMDILLREEP